MFKSRVRRLDRLRMALVHRLGYFLSSYAFRGSAVLMGHFARLFLPPASEPVVIETRYGFRIKIDPVRNRAIDEIIYYYGAYEVGTLAVMKQCLRPGDTFVDIGSNIGFMSLYASRLVGKTGSVYSLEPSPSTFLLLEDNIGLNRSTNIKAINVAVGSKRGTARLYEDNQSSGDSTLVEPRVDQRNGTAVSVEALDDIATGSKVPSPRMIKIDVEGWELEVLRGAQNLLRQPLAPILCIEYSALHPIFGGDVTEIYADILGVNKYAAYKLRDGKHSVSKLVKINGLDELPQHDNLFCFLPSHLETVSPRLFA